jgi:large subunit ribosomal protein L29
MAILRTGEMRDMDEEELRQQLNDLRAELVEERGQIEVGGFAENPGRINEMRKTIARIQTVLNERKAQ